MPETFLPIAQDMPGFNPFFGAWICQDDLNIMVDVGPANTAGRLVDSMETLGFCENSFNTIFRSLLLFVNAFTWLDKMLSPIPIWIKFHKPPFTIPEIPQ